MTPDDVKPDGTEVNSAPARAGGTGQRAEHTADKASKLPFQLLRHFTIASALVVIAITVLVTAYYSHSSTQRLFNVVESQNVALTRAIANAAGPQITNFIDSARGHDPEGLRKYSEFQALHGALAKLTAGLMVLKFQIHDLDGVTIFSTDTNDLGRDVSDSASFRVAARQGKPASMIVHLDRITGFHGEVLDREVVESYVPIHGSGAGIQGVFEVYSDVTSVTDRIARATNNLAIGLIASFAFLYGLLFLIIRRADRVMDEQTRDLIEKTRAAVVAKDSLGREVSERKQLESRLEGAIESLQEAFVFFDADDRLVFCNEEYRRMHPLGDELIMPGISFEEIIRTNVERGNIADAIGREDDHIRERMAQHRNPTGPIIRTTSDGGTFIINERRTPDGGTCLTLADITDLKRTEEALRLSEDRLRGAVAALQEGFAFYDADDRLVFCNDEYRRLHPKVSHILVPGMPFEDLVRANIEQGTNADAIGQEEEHIRERLEQHRNPQGLIVRTLTDGTQFIIQERRTPDGGIVVTETDVTDLHRAQEALGESRRFLQSMIDAVPAMVNAKDSNSRYVFMNRYQAALYGVTPEEAIGRTAGTLVGDEHGDYTRAIDLEILESGRAKENFEETWIDRAGTSRVLLTTKTPLTGEGGIVTHVVTVSLDITERKKMEEAVRESEQRLRAIIDSVPAIIAVKDVESNYLLSNRHHREFFGIGDANVVGRSPSDFISAEHAERVEKKERNVIETGFVTPFYDDTHMGADGKLRTHMMTKAPLRDLSGNIVGTVTAGIDVTERRNLEEMVAAEHRRLLDAIESVDGGVILYDADDRVVLCNSTYKQNLKEIEHLLVPGTRFEDIIKGVVENKVVTIEPGEEEEYIRGRVERHRNLEPSILHMREIDRWYLLREYRTSDGGTLIIRTDITEQKHNEEALRISERRFRDLTDGSVMGIVIDRRGEPLFANQAYANIFGYDSPGEILAFDSLDRLYAPEDLPRIRKHRIDRLEGRPAPDRYEFQGIRKDGAHIWLESRFRIVTWEGEPATQSTVIDITERHRAEDGLKQSEQRLRDIADAASDWFWEMGPDLRYSFVSERFYTETGFESEDVIGKTRLGWIGHRLVDKDEAMWKAYEDDVKNRRPFRNLEYARKEPDGSIRYKRVSGKPIFSDDGEFLGYRGVTADITDYRRAVAELSHHARVESLGKMAGGIAHNLNNMLQPIMILSKLTQDHLPAGSQEFKNLDVIGQACDRATELVNRISSFNRDKAMRPEIANIYEITREGLDLMHSIVPSSITVKENLDKDTGFVRVDATQTQTVLVNLISNAVDAMGGKTGELTISLGRTTVDDTVMKSVQGLALGDYAKLTVADTGAGMDDRTLSKIFDPFFTTKDPGEGTGLGLSTAFGIIYNQKGTIHATSTPGGGTRMEVYLPIAVTERPRPTA